MWRETKLKMVKESSAKMSRLPGPNIFSSSSPGYKAMARSDSGRMPREEQVQEIIELKKALAKTRQDLQKTRTRRGSQDNRTSSDEVRCLLRNSLSGLVIVT